MPFCPQCNAEYTEHILICADCRVALVPERPTEETVEYINWEIVHQVPNEVVGNIIKSVLESAGFDVMLRSHEVVAHGGLSPKPYWGDILVRRDELESAEELVSAYIASLSEDSVENHESDL
jgi:hypothetical protein